MSRRSTEQSDNSNKVSLRKFVNNSKSQSYSYGNSFQSQNRLKSHITNNDNDPTLSDQKYEDTPQDMIRNSSKFIRGSSSNKGEIRTQMDQARKNMNITNVDKNEIVYPITEQKPSNTQRLRQSSNPVLVDGDRNDNVQFRQNTLQISSNPHKKTSIAGDIMNDHRYIEPAKYVEEQKGFLPYKMDPGTKRRLELQKQARQKSISNKYI